MSRPKEFWIVDCGAGMLACSADPRKIPTNADAPVLAHVIEKSAYDRLKDENELLEKYFKTELAPKLSEIEELQSKLKKTEAELWAAKDARLRTYDGLAQKADKADKLEAQLKAAVEVMKAVRSHLGWSRAQDNYANVRNCIDTARRELAEALDKIEQVPKND